MVEISLSLNDKDSFTCKLMRPLYNDSLSSLIVYIPDNIELSEILSIFLHRRWSYIDKSN